jgi:predicted nicotinamide N-methyase
MVRELFTSTCEDSSVGAHHKIVLFGSPVLININDDLGEGGNVWTAVQDLANHLEAQGVDLPSSRVLELGSGPGALAIACAARGASVVASDAPWVTSLTRANAALPANVERIAAAGGSITVSDYLWGADAAPPSPPAGAEHFDVVLVCECVYQLTSGATQNTLPMRAHICKRTVSARGRSGRKRATS